MSLPVTGDVTLGGVTLPDEMTLRGLDVAAVAVDTWRTKGGRPGVLVQQLNGGRELELHGVITRTMFDALLPLAGSAIALVHPLAEITVRITGFDLAPWFEHVEPDATDYYEGSILILET